MNDADDVETVYWKRNGSEYRPAGSVGIWKDTEAHEMNLRHGHRTDAEAEEV